MTAALLALVGGAYAILAGLAWSLSSRISARLEQLSDRVDAQGKELGGRMDALEVRLERGLADVRLEIAGLREELHIHMADRHAHA